MTRRRRLLASGVIFHGLVISACPASAEWFADLYAGAGFTQSHEIVANGTLGQPFTVTGRSVDFDTSPTVGGRFGYWFESVPWLGLGLDVSYFKPDIDRQTIATGINFAGASVSASLPFDRFDLSVTGLSFDAMLRWPLVKSAEIPAGRLQPYLFAGPTVFFATGRDSTNFGPPDHQSDTDTSVGVTAGAGLTWLFSKHFGVFGEYRFTHFSPEFSFSGEPPFGTTRITTDVDSHHVLAGLTFRF